MTRDQWRLAVRENADAGVIALDAKGGILHTNLEGRFYVDLLRVEGQGNLLTLRDNLIDVSRLEQLIYEMVLEGPPQRVLQVCFQPVLADDRLEQWILTLRDAEGWEEEEEAATHQEKRVMSVVHWPPASPATSNLP